MEVALQNDIAIVASTIILLGSAHQIERKERRKKRSVWVKDWLMERERLGAYNALLVDLPKIAHRDYQRFMRMNEETFQVKKVIFVCGHLKKK